MSEYFEHLGWEIIWFSWFFRIMDRLISVCITDICSYSIGFVAATFKDRLIVAWFGTNGSHQLVEFLRIIL